MNKKLLTISSIGTIAAVAAPLAAVVSCGTANDSGASALPTAYSLNGAVVATKATKADVSKDKVVSQSFEPMDFLSTFGKKADYYTTRSDQGVYMDALPTYLTNMYGSGKGDIASAKKIDTRIYDWSAKKAFDPTDLLTKTDNKKSVLLTYQSLHTADAQIKQAFDATVYDDLGNGSGVGTYGPGPDLSTSTDGYKQPMMYDVVHNYKAFSRGLDAVYGGFDYSTQADANAKLFEDEVTAFRAANPDLIGKKILFVRPNKKVSDQATADNFAIWTPLAYNLFYGDAAHNGLGMEFPKPKDDTFPKNTKDGGFYDGWAINSRNNDKANVASKVVDEYAGTADAVVYLVSGSAWDNKTAVHQGFIKSDQSGVRKLLTAGSSESNIYFADYSLFYRGQYGIMGQQETLKKLASDASFATALGITSITAPTGGIVQKSTLTSLSA